MKNKEIWKDIEGYEGLYAISSQGRCWSYKSRIFLNPINNKGYLRVRLYKNKKYKQHYVHRLVAKTFIPNPNNYLEINHKNEIKTDNCVGNLEWCDRSYNVNYGNRNAKNRKTILNYKAFSKPIKCIETNVIYPSMSEATRKTNVNLSHICSVCKGKRKTTGGYHWEYVK